MSLYYEHFPGSEQSQQGLDDSGNRVYDSGNSQAGIPWQMVPEAIGAILQSDLEEQS